MIDPGPSSSRSCPWSRALHRRLLFIACLAPATASCADTTHEFWPELQVFWRLNPSTQILFNPAPTRSREDDQRTAVDWGLYVDYRKPKDPVSYRIGYVYSVSSGPASDVEHRIVLDYNYRWKIGEAGLLTDRTRLDLRDKEGQHSQRLRNRLQYEYEIPFGERSFVPYTNLELYYDSRYHAVARYKVELGATYVFSQQADLTPYFARQTDIEPRRTNVNAIGLLLALHY